MILESTQALRAVLMNPASAANSLPKPSFSGNVDKQV